LPRLSALRRIPAHAFGESQYLLGAFASKIRDKEHSTATLGDSEEAAVQDSPRNVTRPEVNHRLDDSSKVSATVAGKGSWDVFPDGEVGLAVGGAKFANNSSCLMEEAAALPRESCALAGDGEVLARATEGDDINRLQVVRSNSAHVIVQFGIREAQTQDGLRLLVNLAGPSGLEPGALKTKVKAADAGEQRADGSHD